MQLVKVTCRCGFCNNMKVIKGAKVYCPKCREATVEKISSESDEKKKSVGRPKRKRGE